MADLRRSLSTIGLSASAVETIMNSWAPATIKQYNSSLKKWSLFCTKEQVNGTNPTFTDIANFVAELTSMNLSSATVAAHKAAVTSFLEGFGSRPDDPLLSRMMKGVYRQKPSKPKYDNIWDVSIVIRYLKKKSKNERLSLEELTHKMVMLLALTSPKRVSEIARLDLSTLQKGTDKWVFHLEFMNKNRGHGKPHKATFERFEDSRICPITTMEAYIERTQSVRGDETCLILSTIRPHRPVTSSTVARWLKVTLANAGISGRYTAHSTRAASTSAGSRSGLSSKAIMNAANWAPSASTFERFYNRDVEESFQEAILSTRCVKKAYHDR